MSRRLGLLLAFVVALAACTATSDDAPDDGATDQPSTHVTLSSGVQVVVGEVTFEDDLVRIPLQAWNGSTDDLAFAAAEPALEDPLGNLYTYEAPDQATDLFARSGQVVRGTAVFRRAPHDEGEDPRPDPDRVSLVLNPRTTGSAPTIELADLPVTR